MGQLRSPLTACPCNCALGLGEGGNQEAPSPTLPWLFELRCPRRLALVGPRKAVKTRSNGRNNSRGKRPLLLREKAVKTRETSSSELSCPRDTKNLLSSYGLSNLRIGASWNCDRRLLRGGATAYRGGGGAVTFASCCVTVRLRPVVLGGMRWGSYVRLLLRDRATARWW